MQKFEFVSWEPWPHSVIFGSVHWDEKWGTKAILRFVELLQNGEIQLKKWSLTLVAPANPKAYEQNKRYIDANLNRLFKDEYDNLDQVQNAYEFGLVQKLKPILQQADFFLDLHSMEAAWAPFAFAEKDVLDFATKLWIPYVLHWRGNLYPDVIWWDTENYVNQHWWIGITLEWGSHTDPNTEQNLFQWILNFLVATGQIDKKFFKPLAEQTKVLELVDAYVAQNSYPDFKYLIQPEHFLPIKKGTPVLQDGKKIWQAPFDFVLTMPISAKRVKKGEEVFFVAKEG